MAKLPGQEVRLNKAELRVALTSLPTLACSLARSLGCQDPSIVMTETVAMASSTAIFCVHIGFAKSGTLLEASVDAP